MAGALAGGWSRPALHQYIRGGGDLSLKGSECQGQREQDGGPVGASGDAVFLGHQEHPEADSGALVCWGPRALHLHQAPR